MKTLFIILYTVIVSITSFAQTPKAYDTKSINEVVTSNANQNHDIN